MKVTLVFPPQGHFTQPYLSLPSLAAWLRHNGVGQVDMIDASIQAYDHFLSPARLRRSLERVRAGEGLASLEAKQSLRFSEMERYQRLSEIALIGDEVAERIDEAKHVLRTPAEFYDYRRYLWAGRTVEQGLRVISAEHAPTRLTAHGFVMPNRIERSADIVAALDDERLNPFVEYFREHTLPELQRLDPDLIGISVTFPSQAIPTFTLARLIKQWKPDVHITIGGGLLAYTADKLSQRPEVWGLIDSMVLLEGEGPLLQLCEAVEGGQRDLGRIHNLVWRDASGEVRKNDQAQPLDIKTATDAGLRRPAARQVPLARAGAAAGRDARLLLGQVRVLHAVPGDRTRLPRAHDRADRGGHARAQDQVRGRQVLPRHRGPAAQHGTPAPARDPGRQARHPVVGRRAPGARGLRPRRSATSWPRPAACAWPSATRAPAGACWRRCARASTPRGAWSWCGACAARASRSRCT